MAKKRSKWMQGLLQCEVFIKHSGLQWAEFYGDTELWQDSSEFRRGWFDALQHYHHIGVSDVRPD